MIKSSVVSLKDLCKTYKLYDSPADRIKESLLSFKKCYHQDYKALDNISFEIQRGESVGVIGKNGSGKSTLLKILAGIATPTSGNVIVKGRVSALLELGAGFNPDLSGLENVYFNGMLLGLSRKEIDQRVDDILSFADIGDFIYQPVKTYSSGMFVRLAFSVAVNVDPEILIIDEALSVGDSSFQEKCYKRISDLKTNSTVILVTHDMSAIQAMCSRAIVLHRGQLYHDGTPYEATLQYFKLNKSITPQNSGYKSEGKVNLESLRFYNSQHEPTTELESEQTFFAEVELEFNEDVTDLAIGILFRNVYGLKLFGLHSFTQCGHDFGQIPAGTHMKVRFKSFMPLVAGTYLVSVGVTKQFSIENYEHLLFFERFCEVDVYGGKSIYGIFANRHVELEVSDK